MASRRDVVVVTINYRLSTPGFLALEDGVTNGNFGLAGQVAALDWAREYITAFGGGPNRITIFGQSAGAGSVRALLGSPQAIGKFAAVISMGIEPGGLRLRDDVLALLHHFRGSDYAGGGSHPGRDWLQRDGCSCGPCMPESVRRV